MHEDEKYKVIERNPVLWESIKSDRRLNCSNNRLQYVKRNM